MFLLIRLISNNYNINNLLAIIKLQKKINIYTILMPTIQQQEPLDLSLLYDYLFA